MTGGHLLDFSHRTLAEFFEDYGIDITDECYLVGSGSKANKIRGFWTVSDNATFGRVLFGLIQKYDEDRASNDHLNNAYSYTSEYNESNRAKCLDIAYRLTMPQQAPVATPPQPFAPQQAPVINPLQQFASQQAQQEWEQPLEHFPTQEAPPKVQFSQTTKQKVFIVHGHDDALRLNVEIFIRKIGLDPIILMDQASAGDTIIEKLENHGEADYAIILYTACDFGKGKNEEALKARARQNVVFEHGYFIARLTRKRVAAIVALDVETPNDTSGIVYIGANDDWKIKLARELKKAELKFDFEAVFA